MPDLAAITVILGANVDGEVRAMPVVVASYARHMAHALRGEFTFHSWRHAIAFCEVAGIAISNREAAEQLASSEKLPELHGPCWVCGRQDQEKPHG